MNDIAISEIVDKLFEELRPYLSEHNDTEDSKKIRQLIEDAITVL